MSIRDLFLFPSSYPQPHVRAQGGRLERGPFPAAAPGAGPAPAPAPPSEGGEGREAPLHQGASPLALGFPVAEPRTEPVSLISPAALPWGRWWRCAAALLPPCPGNGRTPQPGLGTRGEPCCGPFPGRWGEAPGSVGLSSRLSSRQRGLREPARCRLLCRGCTSPRGPRANPSAGEFPCALPMAGRGMANAPGAQVKETPAIKPRRPQSSLSLGPLTAASGPAVHSPFVPFPELQEEKGPFLSGSVSAHTECAMVYPGPLRNMFSVGKAFLVS